MFSVTVRDHMMIAHSLPGEVFGPAQRLHGATYVVDVELRRPDLDEDGVVVDIGRAADALHHVLAEFNYQNLDDLPALAGRTTTTEVLARLVYDGIVAAIARGDLGPSAGGVEAIRVTLRESPLASASFEGRVSDPPVRESR